MSESRRLRAVTLIELLCVIAIITILASMLLPASMKVYRRAKWLSQEVEGPEIAVLLQQQTLNYCLSHPRFRFASKEDFIAQCRFSPKCQDWVKLTSTKFEPFGWSDPTNKVVLEFHVGRGNATQYSFTKGDFTIRREE